MNNIGSIWHKWDLHLHTASSYDYQYKEKDSDNILINSLNKENISAVAITDHFVIDKDRINKLKSLAPGIVFFPGIELRTDKGRTNIHVILIFSDDSDLQSLCEDFNAFKRTKGKEIINNQRIYWDFNDIVEFAKIHKAIISIHAGRKSNGVDDRITNALEHNEAVKEEFANSVDIFEMGRPVDLEEYKQKVFPSIKKIKPMIICSDNHDPRKYASSLWIKSDLTFDGLKQIINEPDRVSISEPNLLKRIGSNPLKFIKKISVKKKSNSFISDIWYDNINIDVNPGLVAIIGNKGSGKSAITDIIGLCADTHNDNWSFLTPNKFRKKIPYNLSQNFEAQITWLDNSSSGWKSLDSNVDKNQPERVKYIPQNFLENICTTENDKDFENEIKSIIFQHLPDEKKYGKKSLDEVVDYLSKEIHYSETDLEVRINEQNQIIIALEEKKSPDNKIKLKNALNLKKEELMNLEKIKPKEVLKPKHSDLEDNNDTKINIVKLQDVLKQLEEKIVHTKNVLNDVTKKIQDLSSAKDKLDRFHSSYLTMSSELKPVFDDNGLNIDNIVNVKYNVDLIDKKIKSIKEIQDNCNILLSLEGENSLILEKNQKIKNLKALEDKLSEPDRLFQKYLTDLKEWQEKVDFIKGNPKINDTILFYEAQLNYLEDNLDLDLSQAIAERKKLVIELIRKKREILNTYSLLYEPVREFIIKYKKELKSYPIELNASFIFDNVSDLFFDKINQQVSGSFCGKEQGLLRLKELCDKIDLESDDSIYYFAFSLNGMLQNDKRDNCNDENRNIELQLKKGYTQSQLYDFIYDFDYIKPLFKLKLSGKDLSALSPGERGALLLLFYLFIDMDDKPLVIDQPEENLDNESVYGYIVNFIKIAKSKRQVILVTHNPNLAVVCDADQVIKMNYY